MPRYPWREKGRERGRERDRERLNTRGVVGTTERGSLRERDYREN